MEIIFLRCIWWTTEKTIPRKGGTLARGEAINIGKAYESTKINVQKYQGSANRPPAKESIKAVFKKSLRKSSSVITVPAKWELIAFQARNSTPPREQSIESDRSKITTKTQGSIKEE